MLNAISEEEKQPATFIIMMVMTMMTMMMMTMMVTMMMTMMMTTMMTMMMTMKMTMMKVKVYQVAILGEILFVEGEVFALSLLLAFAKG